MKMALELARQQLGRTGANPAVGCVIVRDDVVVGSGATQDGGRPHGEFMALEAAGSSAAGATLFVTLEPCAHKSTKGPTCTDILLHAGVARVVACLEDPDARTAGQGFHRLRAGGVRVEIGLLAEAGAEQIRDFIQSIDSRFKC